MNEPTVTQISQPAGPPATLRVTDPGPTLAIGQTRRAAWVNIALPVRDQEQPPLRLVHLSDLHAIARPAPVYDAILRRLSEDVPDAILITGDFVDDKFDHRPALPVVREFVRRLSSRLGTFGVLGNHDGDWVGARLADWGVINVENNALTVERDGRPVLEVIGTNGVSRNDPPLIDVRPRRPGVGRVVLTHYPDVSQRLEDLHADAIFSGHTHGGQICLPGGRPIITHDSLPRRMSSGVHATAAGWLVISRGIGTARYPVRLFAPPEVLTIDLGKR